MTTKVKALKTFTSWVVVGPDGDIQGALFDRGSYPSFDSRPLAEAWMKSHFNKAWWPKCRIEKIEIRLRLK